MADSRRSTSSHRGDSQDTKDVKGAREKTTRSSRSEQKPERKVQTQITITVGGDNLDQYDPANPTGEEDMEAGEEISLKVISHDLLTLSTLGKIFSR